MKKYLAIYMGSTSGEAMKKWNALSAEEKQNRQAEGMTSWMHWGQKNAQAIRDNGGPLGKTKRVDTGGVSDVKNLLTGYVIVEAESHQAAAEMFLNHPHFSVFPGDSVEIMECPPIPGTEK